MVNVIHISMHTQTLSHTQRDAHSDTHIRDSVRWNLSKFYFLCSVRLRLSILFYFTENAMLMTIENIECFYLVAIHWNSTCCMCSLPSIGTQKARQHFDLVVFIAFSSAVAMFWLLIRENKEPHTRERTNQLFFERTVVRVVHNRNETKMNNFFFFSLTLTTIERMHTNEC